jgi:hypothetical protein
VFCSSLLLHSPELLEKARDLADIETMPYETREIEIEERIKAIGDRQLETKQKLSKEQLEEYKRIIAENNNNHNE